MPPQHRLRVAVLARSVYPLHGIGGLERHVYDLVRHLIAHDVHVTLITKPPLVPTPTPPRERGGDGFLAEAAAPVRPAASEAPGRPRAGATVVAGRAASTARTHLDTNFDARTVVAGIVVLNDEVRA